MANVHKLTGSALTFVLAISIAACDGNDPPPPREATFEGLGDLPGGNFESYANAVSADGSVVVGSGSSRNGVEAFRWVAAHFGREGGVMTGLGDLPGGEFYSVAEDVSADGRVVVGFSGHSGPLASEFEAFRWENGTIASIGDLAGGEYQSIANAVSVDGSVVAGSSISDIGSEAFLWEDGVMIDLELGSSSASDLSVDASVVVGTRNSRAFRWEDGMKMELGTLGGDWSRAQAVSADGAVVVGDSESSDPQVEAFRWEDGAMEGLGDLPGGLDQSFARGGSVDGSVVVGWSSATTSYEAFIWTAADGMRNLKNVLATEYNLDMAGWTLTQANGISSDGKVIVGNGTNPHGRTEAWRAFLGVPVGSGE